METSDSLQFRNGRGERVDLETLLKQLTIAVLLYWPRSQAVLGQIRHLRHQLMVIKTGAIPFE